MGMTVAAALRPGTRSEEQAEALVGDPALSLLPKPSSVGRTSTFLSTGLTPQRSRVPSLELGEEVQSPLRSLKLRRGSFQIVKFSLPSSHEAPAGRQTQVSRRKDLAEAKKVTVPLLPEGSARANVAGRRQQAFCGSLGSPRRARYHEPELWVARGGDIAVRKLAFANHRPDPQRAGITFSRAAADVRNLLSTLSPVASQDQSWAIQRRRAANSACKSRRQSRVTRACSGRRVGGANRHALL